MIETFLITYAIAIIYTFVEGDNGKPSFQTFQEAFLLTASFLMIVHILSSPNTAYLVSNLSPVVVLMYGLVKKLKVGLKKKAKEKEIEETKKQGGTTCSSPSLSSSSSPSSSPSPSSSSSPSSPPNSPV